MRVDLGDLAPSDPSSSLGGLPVSPHDFRGFGQHGPRIRVDDLDAPFTHATVEVPHFVSEGDHLRNIVYLTQKTDFTGEKQKCSTAVTYLTYPMDNPMAQTPK